ncbi:MAG: D-alanine--D-alanine ligase [gamma proteobacterium symbiont of Taylorina sp.]|nr:D-alanine--D-alanine ligase [gamma proteobacterium symbiont of Taylorina sp.]
MNNLAKKAGRIAVMMGGDSAEREVSLNSGKAALEALQNQGFDAFAIDISFNNMADNNVAEKKTPDNKRTLCQQINHVKFDCAFIALHGRGGEDGVIQAILEAHGIPYTGCGVLASALGMDKLRTKLLWSGNNLPTPSFELVSAQDIGDERIEQIAVNIGFPVMVKPNHEGSSIGMSKADDSLSLKEALVLAAQYDDEILVEKWITGKEYTAAIINGRVLPLIQLETPRDFYDYQAKYINDDTLYHCPCSLNQEQEEQYQSLALNAFDSVGAQGWGRVDFMCDENGQAWLIEINTVPGLTSHSLVPMAAKAAGINFAELMVQILSTAVETGNH